MEQQRAVHFEIQYDKGDGEWAELLQERPKTEEEIPQLCDRARAMNRCEKIRAVKVTTTITVERVCEGHEAGILTRNANVSELQLHDRPHELMQDCD